MKIFRYRDLVLHNGAHIRHFEVLDGGVWILLYKDKEEGKVQKFKDDLLQGCKPGSYVIYTRVVNEESNDWLKMKQNIRE